MTSPPPPHRLPATSPSLRHLPILPATSPAPPITTTLRVLPDLSPSRLANEPAAARIPALGGLLAATAPGLSAEQLVQSISALLPSSLDAPEPSLNRQPARAQVAVEEERRQSRGRRTRRRARRQRRWRRRRRSWWWWPSLADRHASLERPPRVDHRVTPRRDGSHQTQPTLTLAPHTPADPRPRPRPRLCPRLCPHAHPRPPSTPMLSRCVPTQLSRPRRRAAALSLRLSPSCSPTPPSAVRSPSRMRRTRRRAAGQCSADHPASDATRARGAPAAATCSACATRSPHAPAPRRARRCMPPCWA